MPRSQTQSSQRRASKSAGPLPPSVERRRRLRQERRRDQLIQAWRLIVFSGSASALAWILLSAGWTLRSIDQLQVVGSDRLGPGNVAKAAGLRFPLPLLSLKPSTLERRLMAELPVQSVTVQRRLLPPGLEVELQDRRPIAAATRRGAGGTEQGMVDRDGRWMPLTVARQGEAPTSAVRVLGWIPSRRSTIAKLLEQRDQLGSPLQVIHIAPDGDLSLRTTSLGLVKLGSNGALLDQQLNTVVQLTRSLPAQLRGQNDTSIDLSDPSKPELQLPAKAAKKASES